MKGYFIGDYHDILNNTLDYFYLHQNLFGMWNNLWPGGFPEVANPLSSRFYPFSFPFYYFSNSIYILNFVVILHILIAFFSFRKLATLICRSEFLLTISALFYAFSGILLTRIAAGQLVILFALAWTPLMYYFLLKILQYREYSVINIFFLVFILVFQYFSGGFYIFVFNFIVLLIFFGYYLLSGEDRRKVGTVFLLVAAFFIAISAIKLLPELSINQFIVRIDPIDPLAGGGFLENNLGAYTFGVPIDSTFGMHESAVFIGIVPLIFAITAFVFGDKKLVVPSFIAVIFAFVWADGGNTLLSFVHFFPMFANFRCPGRILGTIGPLVLFLALYGFVILLDQAEKSDLFRVGPVEKKRILLGTGVLVLLKLLEIPYQDTVSLPAVVSVLILFVFILLLYTNKISDSVFIALVLVSLLVNGVFLFLSGTINPYFWIQAGIAIVLILAATWYYCRGSARGARRTFTLLFVIALLVSLAGNMSYLVYTSPGLDSGPARDVATELGIPPAGYPQVFILDTGPGWSHMDFTVAYLEAGIQPLNGYYPYFLKNNLAPSYTLQGITYTTANYIVDTAYLESGTPTFGEIYDTIGGVPVYAPLDVLPNVFAVRNEQFVPVAVEKYTPDEVIVTGDLRAGDVIVVKTSYYPGWSVNGNPAQAIGNLVTGRLPADSDRAIARFDPPDFKAGIISSITGVLAICALLAYRRKAEAILFPAGGRVHS
ncbi:hypothetical protein J2741_001329 [Methanolinea mesophila]|uniref:hypothetical protein n=1 Tax=Methanolinea mesophila TaxID=547055 RepID=UPI001AE59F99|nr:hypothetical protein [Methanolinea mesophila]MBP1928782.1 hypothetical protein [Methanolinea mesophila]